ncbi:hypothetical protein, partial [Salipiger sp. HF18]|uniref:hypothetical protein n=1 Tax=Salipiger sp. HF18 TaxID=2721557 RepID=UPI001C37A10B
APSRPTLRRRAKRLIAHAAASLSAQSGLWPLRSLLHCGFLKADLSAATHTCGVAITLLPLEDLATSLQERFQHCRVSTALTSQEHNRILNVCRVP